MIANGGLREVRRVRRRLRSRSRSLRNRYGTITFKIPPYKRRKFISLMVVGIFLLSLWLTFWLIDVRLRPYLRVLALAKAKVLATEAINLAVASSGAKSIKYQELMFIKSDSEGRPVLLQPNTGEINAQAARLTLAIQHALAEIKPATVRLPVGQVLGTQMLGLWGPRIRVSILPLGTVEGRIIDSFDSVGINQTRHRICLRVTVEIKVVAPFIAANEPIRNDVPLAEAVIVGQVPDVYMDSGVMKK